jgi:hypothetical protein
MGAAWQIRFPLCSTATRREANSLLVRGSTELTASLSNLAGAPGASILICYRGEAVFNQAALPGHAAPAALLEFSPAR